VAQVWQDDDDNDDDDDDDDDYRFHIHIYRVVQKNGTPILFLR